MQTFKIVNEYVPKEELLLVAKAVLLSQDIREESWSGTRLGGAKYEKDIMTAVQEAVLQLDCKKFWTSIIYGWNVVAWNDCQEWAKEVIKIK